MKKELRNKVLSWVVVAGLFAAMWVSWVLWGFWRTLDNLTSNGVANPESFNYGYGYGDNGFGYGYGYGYGYGDYGYGYGYGDFALGQPRVDWVCWVANGSNTYRNKPTGADLCSAWVASVVAWNINWSWTCSGQWGGENATCSARQRSGGWGGGGSSSGGSSSGGSSSGGSSSGGVYNPNTGNTNTTKPADKNKVVVTVDKKGNVSITTVDGKKAVFSDISNSFALKYIASLTALGVVNGYEDGTFRPENNASRAEYLKMVLKAMKVDYSNADTSALTFKDVEKDSWIAKVVVKAVELKMISANENFRPNDSVSRAEAMKMLLNSAKVEVKDVETTDFTDVNVKSWEAKYIQKAKELGVVNGQTVNEKLVFKPFTNITRAEVSKIVVKTMEIKN